MRRVWPRLASAALASFALFAVGCSKQNHTGGARAAQPSDASAASDESASGSSAETEPESAASEPGTAAPEATGAGSPAKPQQQAALKPVVSSGPPLPEVEVKTFGLHVGGGRNDAAEKEPLLKPLERSFPRLLDCYKLVEEPGKDGSFGVDLQIGVEGGRARVAQPRTGLKGEEFKSCMVRVFESVKFETQKRPTTISYSVKFKVGKD